MTANYDVIVIFPIYGQFGAIWKLNLQFCQQSPFILRKLKSELTTLQHSSHSIALSKVTIFAKKFWRHQYWEGLDTKWHIFWNYICVCTNLPNFKFFSIIQTSFRQGRGGSKFTSPPFHLKKDPKKPTQIRVNIFAQILPTSYFRYFS